MVASVTNLIPEKSQATLRDQPSQQDPQGLPQITKPLLRLSEFLSGLLRRKEVPDTALPPEDNHTNLKSFLG